MEARNEKSSPLIRVLMLPWLAHGHISPYLELAKRLANKNFYIYLCSTPINLNSIKKRITQKQSLSIQLVEFHLPTSPTLPPHYHTTNGLPPHLMTTLRSAFHLSGPTFSNILKTLSPDLLIYDYNQAWSADAALSQNIPAVQFLTGAAVMIAFSLHHLVKNPTREKYPFPEIYFYPYEIKLLRKMSERKVDDTKDGDRFLESIKGSSGLVLIKSFREIEGKHIDYLSSLLDQKVVPAGALVQEPVDDDEVEKEQVRKIMEWLGKKDESSVVYVSFGSECFLSVDEREEVAKGLELSDVNFIWVIRFLAGDDIKIEDALPKGFLERIGDRGLIVEKWAPQAKILEHSSTGGFVSHCGWSSVTESMKFGVPIIAVPMLYDQPFNARVMTEVGVGMEVIRSDDESGKLKGEEIADVIRKVVVDKDGENVRKRARELSVVMKINEEAEVNGVVEELVQLCKKSI